MNHSDIIIFRDIFDRISNGENTLDDYDTLVTVTQSLHVSSQNYYYKNFFRRCNQTVNQQLGHLTGGQVSDYRS